MKLPLFGGKNREEEGKKSEEKKVKTEGKEGNKRSEMKKEREGSRWTALLVLVLSVMVSLLFMLKGQLKERGLKEWWEMIKGEVSFSKEYVF